MIIQMLPEGGQEIKPLEIFFCPGYMDWIFISHMNSFPSHTGSWDHSPALTGNKITQSFRHNRHWMPFLPRQISGSWDMEFIF